MSESNSFAFAESRPVTILVTAIEVPRRKFWVIQSGTAAARSAVLKHRDTCRNSEFTHL